MIGGVLLEGCLVVVVELHGVVPRRSVFLDANIYSNALFIHTQKQTPTIPPVHSHLKP